MLNAIFNKSVGLFCLLMMAWPSLHAQNSPDTPVLTVGIDLTYAPYAYLEQGEPAGFDPDFMRLIAQQLNVPVTFKDTRIENIIIGLDAGQHNVVASALYVNSLRAKQVDFLPYLQTGGVLVVRGDDPFRPQTVKDLCGKSVSSMKGAAWIPLLAEVTEQHCLPNGLGPIVVKEFPSAPEAAQALLSGGVDVQYEDAAVAQMVINALGSRMVISTEKMINPVLIGLAFSKNDTALRLRIHEAIQALRASGQYDQLLKKYNLAWPEDSLLAANAADIAPLSDSEQSISDQGFNWTYLGSLFFKKEFWVASARVVALSTLAWAFAVVFGFFLALAQRSNHWVLHRFAATYIWFFRSLPLLVLLIFIYNLPQAFPALRLWLSNPFIAGLLALILSESAYIAEIHRGSLHAISSGQYEAGRVLGLSHSAIYRFIIIPQALRIALPSLANQYVTIIKLTSLVSVISLTEILLTGQQLYTHNFLVMETLLAVALYYVLIVTVVTGLLRRMEHKLDVSQRKTELDHELKIDPARLETMRHIHLQQQGSCALEIKQAQKYFGQAQVLKNINVSIPWGQVVSVIGPSGSGKSTLIRSINGLETLDSGEVLLSGKPFLQGSHAGKPVSSRQYRQDIVQLGIVFQNYNLFPHLTVLDNVLLAPRWHRHAEHDTAIREYALAMLDKVGMLAHANKYPHQISGGQQQRVAIARALAMKPSIMLFDEATAALDPEMVDEVLKIIAELASDGMTMILVTHEMKFALDISDRIIFMEHGQIGHDGSPQSLRQMANPRLLQFIGLESANPGAITQ